MRLEHLERINPSYKPKYNKKLSIFNEIKTLIIIFFIVFVWMLIFTNINLFANSIKSSLDIKTSQQIKNIDYNNSQEDSSISTIIQTKQEKLHEIQELIEQNSENNNIVPSISPSVESLLQEKIKRYDFKFNTLPPTNRLIIKSLWIDIPLIDSQYKDAEDFTIQNFDKELMNWVVKYPTTPSPWQWGNTLIFGHTSQERRQKNPYWTIFSQIPNLTNWDKIQVVREWNLYEYAVVDKTIVIPSKVNSTFLEYNQKWEYLTLMWCYPLGRTDKRIMIMAQQIK